MTTDKRPCPICKGKAMTFTAWLEHMAAKHNWKWKLQFGGETE